MMNLHDTPALEKTANRPHNSARLSLLLRHRSALLFLFTSALLLSALFFSLTSSLQQSEAGMPASGISSQLPLLAEEVDQSEESALSEPTVPATLTLAFGGDVMFDTFIYNWMSNYGIDYPWQDVAPFFQAADIGFVNFESSSSLRGASTKPEGYGFCSPPHTLESLLSAGIDYVSLGNNHVLDYGIEAFSDTLSNLSALGIAYSGAGMNICEAEAMAILERQGLKIGFLSYNEIIPYSSWWPDDESSGTAAIARTNDIERALQNITACRPLCDLLIVLPHWGTEYSWRPAQSQRDLAHRMIEAGADIIIGGHPHVLQGIEFYQGKPIFYSIGNFIFLKMDDDAGKTAVFTVTMDNEGLVSAEFHPVFIDSCKANLLDADHWMYQQISERLRDLSAELGTTIIDNRILAPNDIPLDP